MYKRQKGEFYLPTVSPKQAFTLVEATPDEKVYELCIKLKDTLGAIAETAKILSDNGVNIKTSSLFYGPKSRKFGFWTSFIDFSKANNSIKKLEKELRKLPAVLDVKFEEPKPAPYEIMHFPILHQGSRAIVMPVNLFGSMLNGIERILTHSGFAAVMYESGKKTGKRHTKYFKDKFGLETREDLIEALIQGVKAIGWASVTVQEIDSEQLSATLIAKENFEAIAQNKKPYKACHFSRGFIAGYFGTVFGKPVDVTEIKCFAAGDEHCEFKIKPAREQGKIN